MDIYYLYNSGFTVVADGVALVIDYCRGGLSDRWRMPLPLPPPHYRQALVLCSHAHGDHFVKGIFTWLDERPDISFMLSSDIAPLARKATPTAPPQNIRYLDPGDEAQEGGARVRAFGSTDEGISFLVDLPAPQGAAPPREGGEPAPPGLRLFHAGDLNFWHWSEESTQAEVEEARAAFVAELAKIKDACETGPDAADGRIDAAFFPVDPRMGADYYRGAVMFCEALRPKLFVPMHFGAKFDPPRAFYDEVAPYAKVARIVGRNMPIAQ